jgi:hypothetical protein
MTSRKAKDYNRFNVIHTSHGDAMIAQIDKEPDAVFMVLVNEWDRWVASYDPNELIAA